jgi:hypothetical protein
LPWHLISAAFLAKLEPRGRAIGNSFADPLSVGQAYDALGKRAG